MKPQSVHVQVRGTFLSVWPTAFRILPFKVRPHSASPYPPSKLDPSGAPTEPRRGFCKLSPASHAITSARNFRRQVPFLRPLKATAAGVHSFYALFGGALTLSGFAQMNYGRGSKVEHAHHRSVQRSDVQASDFRGKKRKRGRAVDEC